ncbi:pantoate--beta-alanine ligase [Desulfurispira natronophila]|uniref:Pantothenate synthetase n=1 Tax=Desulfurispira natronophila TaxID=682562 RepID=A0A7W7Y2V5_9BACT|nr:pantoate--beta-alanine ligase [Desulfurispira natronophila]
MQVIHNKKELCNVLGPFWQKASHTIGLVPTMGYLHTGHLSLVERCNSENACTVLSIFVNPTQFGPDEDLETYPRDLERDLDMACDAGVDYVFAPQAPDIYLPGHSTWIEVVSPMTNVLCGASRPGHFRGVTTVVAKLIHLVQPQRAYFGEKDFQQLAVIRQMVRDINIPVEIVSCPIVREPDGLAMSSRNKHLDSSQREAASLLYQSLLLVQELVNQGQRDSDALRQRIIDHFSISPHCEVDYIEFANPQTLELQQGPLQSDAQLLLAVKVGPVRLIDNYRIILTH